MKTKRFLVGIIAFVAIMGFTFVACSGKKGGESADGGKKDSVSADSDKKDNVSASGGKIQYAPEGDFRTKEIDGGKGIEIIKYIGDKGEVNIPPKIRDIPVTEIDNSAFAKKNIISVIIPNSVTTIGGFAFEDNQLTSIIIPNSVNDIGRDAFTGNPLTSITIGAGVTLRTHRITQDDFGKIYYEGGEAAGTYTRPDASSDDWSKK
jgi:hypothetical protein